jgi:hypothetical protein
MPEPPVGDGHPDGTDAERSTPVSNDHTELQERRKLMLKEATEELKRRYELVERRLEALKEEIPLLEEEKECLGKLINLYQRHPHDAITEERRATFKVRMLEDIEGLKDEPSNPYGVTTKKLRTKPAIELFEKRVTNVLEGGPARFSELLKTAGYKPDSTSSMRLCRMVEKNLVTREDGKYSLRTKGGAGDASSEARR